MFVNKWKDQCVRYSQVLSQQYDLIKLYESKLKTLSGYSMEKLKAKKKTFDLQKMLYNKFIWKRILSGLWFMVYISVYLDVL